MVRRNGLRGAARLAACVVVAAAGALPAALAAGGPASGRPAPGDAPNGDEMRAAVEQVLIVRLKRVLQMTPAQEGRVIPKVHRMLDERREFAARRRIAVSHLRATMIDETSDGAEIDKALADLLGLEEAHRARERRLKEEIGADLTPRQRARMYFFEDRFRRVMQQRLRQARPGAGPGAAGRPPRAPAPDDGDPEGPDDDAGDGS